MPRKGTQKVRTGCVTCKARRIKCDEAWPKCYKCKSSGRKCGGYELRPVGSFSWEELLQPSPRYNLGMYGDANTTMQRGLVHFREALAPVIDGPVKTTFWMYHVQRAVQNEAAVRHAVLAISLLLEHADLNKPIGTPRGLITDKVSSAIWHYNKAIRHVISLKHKECAGTIPLICLLFVCIEFLQADFTAAFQHFKSGASILNPSTSCPELLATYRHLLIFPPFTHHSDSASANVEASGDEFNFTKFESIDKAQELMDCLVSRTAKLTYFARLHFIGTNQPLDPLDSASFVQQRLVRDLDRWRASFSVLQQELAEEPGYAVALLFLEMRYLITFIRVKSRLPADEMSYDECLVQFKRVVEIGGLVRQLDATINQHRFTFRGGFCPLLQTVVMKCRDLETRWAALDLMQTLSCYREAIWHFPVMYVVAQRAIQMEHGIPFSHDLLSTSCRDIPVTYSVPPKHCRIVEYSWDFGPKHFKDSDGISATGYGVRFWKENEEGNVMLYELDVKI